ncbi:MAG: cytochrome c [Desulfuromonadales bacterium]|jgi:mono/diheme cytochrome c family protein|nr:cytochrome c [Desulfuromonadales bacterium]
MKNLFKSLLALALVALFTTSVLAADDGNPRKGKHLYKKNCKTCHSVGSEDGELTPMSKTMKQWDRIFAKKKHDQEAWKNLSEQDLKDVNQFLFDFAADSEQPATCG